VHDTGLVIFDCDGVLVDSEAISTRVLAEVLSAAGLPTTPTQALRDYQGLMLADIEAHASAKLGRVLPRDWIERFERERTDAFRRELRSIPGAAEAVERVSALGIAVCVASQGKLAKTELTLGLTGMRALFGQDALFSAYSVPNGKPAPDLFLHAAASIGVEPAGCVVVEDSVAGVTAAVAAGMRAFGYAADGTGAALREAGAQVLLGSMDELPALLRDG
jgi:HAD superfamily hydrolase (TIGR01509 family)